MASDREPQRVRRVAHVVRRYGVPSQTFVADAVSSLDDLGWEAWVLARSLERRDWFPFPPDDRVVLAKRPPLGARVAGRMRGTGAADRRAAWWRASLGRIAPDLIHAHFGWACVDALPLASHAEVPLVATFHGTDLTVYPGTPRGSRDYARLLPRLDRAIVVSAFLAALLRRLGYDGQVDIVPTGIALGDLPLRRQTPPARPLRLVFVGRQVPVKGLDVLLEAMPALCARHPELALEVIGDGPEAERNAQLAGRLGIARRVEFRGARPRDEVHRALRRAHVLVVPSRTMPDGQAEGAGLVPKEALAVGVPVVATDSGGLPETMPPAHRAELVPEGDPVALGAAVDELLAGRADWPARALAGRRWVETRFDQALVARRTAAIYEELVEERPGRLAGLEPAVAGTAT